MNSKLVIANICRWVARILSIPLVPIALIYLLFVGLQIPSEGGDVTVFILYAVLLAAMLAGLVIAWWREAPGSILALAALAGTLLAAVLTGSREMLEQASPLAGPIHLLFALTMPGYHPQVSPVAKWVPWISWGLIVAPIVLFLFSWLLRRSPAKK